MSRDIDTDPYQRDNNPLTPPPLTQEELKATKTPEGKPIINKGVGKIVDFHGDWGTRINIQSGGVVEKLNTFLRDPRTREFFPEGTTVRPHPNGDSLVWEWTDKNKNVIRWQQTARPSWQISTKSKVGGGFVAEETPWGFMATEEFEKETDKGKGEIIAHEAYHQMMQIGKQGKARYLIDIRGQLIANTVKNIVKPAEKRTYSKESALMNGYYDIRQEQEAHDLSKIYEKVLP